jgi:heavy metal efflux system protein
MLRRVVSFALRLPVIVVALAAVVIVGGLAAYRALPVEAYPNPVPPLVEVITQPPGWSAEEVERYVTIPLEIALSGMPGLEHMRSQSLFGLSDVKCYFRWGTEYEKARQEVINRLQFVQLPAGIQAQLSPWNAIGEVFRYIVRGKGYTLQELKTAQDWILQREFKQVPGVIDVVSFGGETRQYHVEVDPYHLRAHSISLGQLTSGISNANQNVGGQRLPLGEQSYTVRGIGLIRSLQDIRNVVIAQQKGVPIRVEHVAQANIGAAPRLGKVGYNGDEDVVQGIVLMRYGGVTKDTLDGVYKRVEHLRKNHVLPPGMDIEPYYDRGNLVKVTTHTVMENLLLGMGLVSLVLFAFLGSARAALITAINIPLALLIAFIGMVATGTPANLISLGAVDFGIVVDSTVIMSENIFRHLGHEGGGSKSARIRAAAGEVGRPMAFSTLIIAVAFLPLFTMTGVSGVIFSPMARTYALAIGGAILLALTLTPVLASRVLKTDEEERENFLMRSLHRVYNPIANAALRHPRTSVLLSLVPIGLCVVLFPFLGGEFMPKLEEGNLWVRVLMSSSVSLEQSSRYVGRMREILKARPEVEAVLSQLGRPDDGTDMAGFHNIELFAPLRPASSWPRGVTKESLTDDLTRELQASFPGMTFNFSQYLLDNVEEAVSGVKAENSIKVFGPDLTINEHKGEEILATLARVSGVKDLGMFRSLGQPSIKIVPDRDICARYGLNTGDVDAVVQAAIGGQAVTQVYEGEKHFDLTVRWAAPYRNSVSAIRQILVSTPDGTQLPLGQLASITEEVGPSLIYREDGRRYTPVKFSVRGRDLASTVEEARSQLQSEVKLPWDTRLEWAGEMNELKDAMGRLSLIIPITLLLIALLVYAAVRSWVDTVLVILAIPVACTGGVLALLVTGESFSVSAAMGFISIFGIAVQDGILVVTYAQRLWAEGRSLEDGARLAAEKRFRPVFMTTLVAMVGLLPAALSNGIGAQTQKPLAIVVIGGALILAMLSRIMRPPMLVLAHRWFGMPPASVENGDKDPVPT